MWLKHREGKTGRQEKDRESKRERESNNEDLIPLPSHLTNWRAGAFT